MRIGVYLDLSNLYYQSKRRYNKKIDFKLLYEFLYDFGDITIINAYGSQRKNEAERFITYLKEAGYTPVYKQTKEIEKGKYKANWDVGISIDAIRDKEKYDTIILGTSDSDYIPLIEYLKEQNKSVYILGIDISNSLKTEADEYLNIPSSIIRS